MSSVCMVMPVVGSTRDSTATNSVKFAPYPSSLVRSPNTFTFCSAVQPGWNKRRAALIRKRRMVLTEQSINMAAGPTIHHRGGESTRDSRGNHSALAGHRALHDVGEPALALGEH